jgi:hypothetical protein
MNRQATPQAAKRPYVVGVFDDYHQAERAMSDLVAAGFPSREIGFAMRGDESRLREHEKAEAYGEAAVSRVSSGAVAGAVLGGALGAISSLLIPGFGPVLLSGILVMAAGGGIAGGFAGLISTMQLSEEEKLYYHRALEAGHCLVFVRAGDRYSEALAILESNGAHDTTRSEPPTEL